jgi:hypothetical protein
MGYNKSMKRITKETNMSGSVMDNFFRGMGSISLFPQLPDSEPEISPWQSVLDAFAAANRNLTDAIYEFKKTQGIDHQTFPQ